MICKFYASIAVFLTAFNFLNAQTDNIVINEFVALSDSLSPWTDPAGEHDDWIELYNLNSTTVSLGGYYLSDDYLNPMKWQMPAGVSIPANGYLIIWADDDIDQTGLHAPFKLSRDGEELMLSKPDLTVLDSVTFGYQETNLSYARIPNGTGNFIITIPTFNANNGSSSVATPTWANEVNIYPNPVSQREVTIEIPVGYTQKVSQITLLTVDNKSLPISYTGTSETQIRLRLPELNAGFYLLHLRTEEGTIIRKLLVL
jgi:hypothetical protein